MEGAAKKARRIPEVLVVPPTQLLKSKPQQQQQLPMQQIPPQAFFQQQQQQSKRAPTMLTPASPQMQQFFQHQLQSQTQPQAQPRINQQFHHPPHHLRQPHIPKKSLENLHILDLDPNTASQIAPWMLPAAINMPLHAVSPGFSLMSSSPAAAPAPSPSNVAAPVRRVGAKRVAGPDDWRLANSSPSLNSSGAPGSNVPPSGAPPGPGYVVSPANFSGSINVSVPGVPHRVGSSAQTPVRATGIEKRKLKLKQVTAAYQTEYQEACQRLLALQREWREECEPKLSQENYILV